MKTNLKLRIAAAITTTALLSLGCATGTKTVTVLGQEVLDVESLVCDTQIEWDGVSVVLEGVAVDKQEAADKYTLGKVSNNDQSIRQLDSVALAIDSHYAFMCKSIIALKDSPSLPDYLVTSQKTALSLIQMLHQMEAVNSDDKLSEAQATAKQREIAKDVLSTNAVDANA